MDTNPNKSELTFHNIFALIKKGIVRITIFMVIAAVLVGLVGGIIILANRETAAFQSIIEFNYEGIEDGLDPWGRKLDVNKLKADNIITSALVENRFSEERRLKLKNLIKENLKIEGIVPQDIIKKKLIINEISIKNPTYLEQLNDLSYQCTDYMVTLTNSKQMKLTNAECLSILNSIVDNYITDFRSAYGYSSLLGTLIARRDLEITDYEYVELFDIYNSQVEDILRFIDHEMIPQAFDFRSSESKLSFQDMRSRVKSIMDYNIKSLEIYVFDKAVAREAQTTAIDVVTYIDDKIEKINKKIAAIDALSDELKVAMADFREFHNTRVDVNGAVENYLVNGDIYQQYSTRYLSSIAESVDYTMQKELWEGRIDKFNRALNNVLPEAEVQLHRDKVDSMLLIIEDKLATEIALINAAIDEFIEVEVMKDSISKSIAAVKRPANDIDIKLLILSEVLAVFIAFIIAIAITSAKEKKLALLKNGEAITDNT